ncbi:DNA primase [Orbaceae bacterium ac157xtp]
MKFIPRDFITDLVARANVVDIVGARVKLKKRGNDYWGNCPFHNEKTPSFAVSDKRQIYHCFGCGVTGTALDFIKEFDRLRFPEAVEELASYYGITVPYVNSSKSDSNYTPVSNQNTRRDLFNLMAKINSYYQAHLKAPKAQRAREYLVGRGLESSVIEQYGIGYAPDEWTLTLKTFAKTPEDQKLYEEAGMLVINDNGKYDRFRDRIMFPIRDRQGNIIAFGGRALRADDKAKYLNSPETAIFHKGRQLYGLYELQQINRNPNKILVVEGYMDVVSLAQFGINYAVAALGTATTSDHIKLLFRLTDTVIFCYDGDDAGRKAAWRALTVLLPALVDNKQFKFVFLPQDEDPDSLVRKEGKEAFEARLDNGITLSQFLFDSLLKEVDLKTPEGKAKLGALAIPLINQVTAKSFNLNLKQQLGDYLGYLDITQINKLLNEYKTDSFEKKSEQESIETPQTMKLTTIRILLGLLLQYPELAKLVADVNALKAIKLNGIEIFIDLLKVCHNYPTITTAQILSKYAEAPYYKQLNMLAAWDHKYDENEVDSIFSHTLKELYDNILSQRQDELIAKDRTSKLTEAEKKELATIILVLSKKD